MKTTILILTASALAIGSANAEGEAKKREGQNSRPEGGWMSQIDKDGDKAISKEEAGERWERLSKLDTDNDGKVTGQELMAARQGGKGREPGNGAPGKGRPGQGGKGDPGEFLKRMDKNNDGGVTADEVPEQFWARLSKADSNNDGKVTFEEAKANAPERAGGPGGERPRPGSGEMFKTADKNEDGKISKDEVPEQAWARLGKLDKDGDGAVSRDEIAAMAGGAGRGGDSKGGSKGKGKGGQQGGPGAIFGKMDKNGDDKLSKDEVPDEMWAKLRNADEDADGTVSKKELEKSYQRRQ